MNIRAFQSHHFVKSEDLNSHGTLFAGQGAKWFVESGFIAAAGITSTQNIVCMKIHGMLFKKPVPLGTLVCFESKVVLAGRVSLVAYVKAFNTHNEEFIVDGFLTFVHVDLRGKPSAHGITLEVNSEDEKALHEMALRVLRR